MKIGVCKFIHHYKETGIISLMPGSRKASKFTVNAKIIEERMERDDEMTGIELLKLLAKNDIQVASLTALRWRTDFWASDRFWVILAKLCIKKVFARSTSSTF